MSAAGIVRNEKNNETHERGWASVLGVEGQKAQLMAWAALTLQAADLDRTATAINRLAVIEGPPGTGKTTIARNLAAPLSQVIGRPVRVIEFAAHEVMSGEHGRTQREVHAVLTETIPDLADGDPTVLVVDEVEALAIARGSVSLEANPVDVHRTTDAVITALDILADRAPNVVAVMTTNFPDLVDSALRSRADLTITVPLPSEQAINEIVRDTLTAWAAAYPDLKRLTEDPRLESVAKKLFDAETDARQVRKFVLESLTSDLTIAAEPGRLTIDALIQTADNRREQT